MEALAIVLMWLAIIAVYWWPKVPGGLQLASDFHSLHVHRMNFARETLATHGTLPAWYPRELLGTPFWSNIQSFPFIPNRLLILLLDPEGQYTYTLAITLAAILGASFTYLFTRRLGIGVVGSAAAGWTFVCCGYFASRVAAGHLPLLEVYFALPLLLWCVESIAQAKGMGRPIGRWVLAIGLSSMCVMLAGHPQLPVYALATAGLYVLWRIRLKGSIVPLAGMALGVGCASFVLVPMTMLIGRSTRILPLAEAGNDLALPYGRLLGFFFPWWDGAAVPLSRSRESPFTYTEVAYFWDTFCYAGWMPWLAAILLLVLLIRKRVQIDRRAVFVLAMGLAGIILALPFVQQINAMIPGTFLRSPARLLYLTELSLAIGLGAALNFLLQMSRHLWVPAAIPTTLLIHVLDVGIVAREFDVRSEGEDLSSAERVIAPLLEKVGDGRITTDTLLDLKANRRFDDIGFFDSIMLARPYTLLIDLTGAPVDYNDQQMDGSQFSLKTLEATGVMAVFTTEERPDLRLLGKSGILHVHATDRPAPRAQFFPVASVAYVEDSELRNAIRQGQLDPRQWLLIPRSVMPKSRAEDTSIDPPAVRYTRVSPDRIECSVTTGQVGYLRIIESFDPGWRATVNGVATQTIPALGALLAVPLNPGTSQVVFEFHTPGKWLGIALTCMCATGLGGLTWFTRTRRRLTDAPAESARSAAGG